MPLSTQTLAWETVATFFLHAVIPIAIGLGILAMKVDILTLVSNKFGLLPWIILFIVLSFFVNMGFLAQLQIEGCSGLKDWSAILLGALKAVAIALPFAITPLFSEWARLLISQVVIRHLPLAAPGQEEINTVTVSAADTVETIATGVQTPSELATVKGIGGVLGHDDYLRQSFNEMGVACAYMSAFGGAIGFAAGSWGVTSCRGGGGKKA